MRALLADDFVDDEYEPGRLVAFDVDQRSDAIKNRLENCNEFFVLGRFMPPEESSWLSRTNKDGITDIALTGGMVNNMTIPNTVQIVQGGG